jgi:hypothetical protein
MKLKYRIKQYEEQLTRWKGTEKLSERVETIYQVEFRQDGFWGRLVGWSERGAFLFTEQEAREKIEYYKKLDREPPFKKRIVYTNID